MGEIRTKVMLENRDDRTLYKAGNIAQERIRSREIDAVVDTSAVMTLLPQDLVDDLGLELLDRRLVQLADDRKIEMPCAAGLNLTIVGRQMTTDCLVGPPGCEPLIGQIVLESLDLIPDPYKRTLTPRPESPLRPTLKLKEIGSRLIPAA